MPDLKGPRPPRLSEALLQLSLPHGIQGEDIVGALSEEFLEMAQTVGHRRANLWYRRQAMGLILRAVVSRATSLRREPKEGRGMDSGAYAMLKEVALAIRRLSQQPTFAFTAIATLSIGIGATAAIFSTINATLLRPLPYPESENIYTLSTALTDGRWSSGRITHAYVGAINEFAPSVLQTVAVYTREDVIVTDEGENRLAGTQLVTEGFFDLFNMPMALGRALSEEDYAAPTAVISSRVWSDVFGRGPAVIDQTMRLATGPVTVVGVAPPEFDAPAGTDVWVSYPLVRSSVAHSFEGYLRVRPDTDETLLKGELATVMAGLAELYPQAARGRAFVVTPLVTTIIGDLGPILIVVLAGAGVLLLLGSLNVATLVLGRGTTLTTDIAVRVALGADRAVIVRRFLSESLVIATAGTIGGLVLAWVGVRVLLVYGASELPRLDQIPFDRNVLLFAVGMLVATTVMTGLIPAMRLTTPDIRGLLNRGGRTHSRARGTQRLLAGLVVAEVALAIVLVSGAGWLVRSYANLSDTDPGFVPQGRLMFTALLTGTDWLPRRVAIQDSDGPAPDPDAPPPESPITWLRAVSDRLQASGQVGAVGSANTLPLDRDWEVPFYVAIAGEPYDAERQETARLRSVSPTFFDAMGTRMLAGRTFAWEEPDVAVVNEAFVRRYLPELDPLNESLHFGFPVVNLERPISIVGVVEDVKYASLREPADPIFYLPGRGARQSVVVETSLDDPTQLIPLVLAEVAAVDPEIPITVGTYDAAISSELVRHRVGLTLMSLFAVVSLALAAVGIYGVIARVTGQRRTELATRMAFGAAPSDVRALILKQGMTLALAGLTVGLGMAYLGGRLMESRLHEVSAADPVILTIAASAVLSITLIAFLVPAVKASHREPSQGLSAE